MSVITEYDAAGNLSSAFLKGRGIVVSSSEKSANRSPAKPVADAAISTDPSLNGSNYVNWGDNNNWPVEVVADLRLNGMADRALNLKAEMLYGKRLVTCRVTSFDVNTGTETLETVNDPEINEFLQRSNINLFRNRLIHDFVRLGNCFPMMHMNEDRSKIVMMQHDKAAKFRMGVYDASLGRIDKNFRSAHWPTPTQEQIKPVQAINSYIQFWEIDRVRREKHTQYSFHISSYDLLNDYYAVPIWNAVRANGHLKNSNNIPKIISGMMKNAISLKYHIKIPMTYWTGMYAKWTTMPQAEKDSIVNTKLDEMDRFLTDVENPMKTFISHFAIDPMTNKEMPGWEILPLDDKMNYDAWTGVATSASAEILFAIGINPALFGLATPGVSGNSGQGNGGSNIREAWLVMIASSQGERDTLHCWWPFVRDYNKWDSSIELRVIDQVLTTLDSGKGTTKTLS